MQDIVDCLGRLACRVDCKSGYLETRYKGSKTSIVLPLGEKLSIERQGVRTDIIRGNDFTFRSYSYKINE